MSQPPNLTHGQNERSVWLSLFIAFVLLYFFLVGINCLGGGMKSLGKGAMDVYFSDSMNPILALLVGILATTLVQSSSVTTALVVGFVAANQISIAAAVPMIMGANIGTTVTNTIASLAHAARENEFRRAFAAATCHDFFNYLSVLILLPIELISRAIWGQGLLEWMARTVADALAGVGGATYKSPVKAAFKAGKKLIESAIDSISGGGQLGDIILVIVGFLIILISLTSIVKIMRGPMVSRIEKYVTRFLGSGGPVAILVGLILTVMAQSSSITTSTLVPLAGAGIISLQQIYPVTLGANIGTTVTALLAALAAPENAEAALTIAIVHLLFNLAGILIWYVPSYTRAIPLRLATKFADIAAHSKRWAFVYVCLAFYALPAAIFFLAEAFTKG
jgi:sodium-dependent phosphate cotransporter